MTPDKEIVRTIHEGGLALVKVHQKLSMAQKSDMPISLNKKQSKALERILRLSEQIVSQAQLLPLAERRPRS